jgi:hypothetical protein
MLKLATLALACVSASAADAAKKDEKATEESA